MSAAEASPIALIAAHRARDEPSGRCIEDPAHVLDNTAFAGAVDGLAVRLAGLGVGSGDTVAVMLPNCVEMVVTMFAAWSLGAALTPVNPALTDDEVQYQLQDSKSVLIVGEDRSAGLAAAAGAQFMPADGMLSEVPVSERPDLPVVKTDDFALVIYTSGTTGRPKGVLLDHANLVAMCASIIEGLQLSSHDTSLVVLPLFHVNGLVVSVLSTLRAGGAVVIAPRFSADSLWGLVESRRPTYFSAVPTIYALLESRPPRAIDTSSLRFVVCGASPMPTELIARFETRFGVPIIEGYGLSEATVASSINPIAGPRKPGTVGVALPGQDIAIVNPDGQLQPTGSPGEVIIRGANVMRGYLGKPDVTAATIRDGWLHTGDVGYLDEDGYLVLVDRIKDMIIRGGENIYPKEIEEVLYRHPTVLEAAVVGQPDPVMGEVPVAFVALRPGSAVTGEQLAAHCEKALARYKRPKEIRLMTELPKNSIGKIIKGSLRTILTAKQQ